MKTTNMFLFGILLVANVALAEPTQAQAEAPTPKSVLSQIVGKVLACDKYSINYGSNKPLNEVCVNRLVESTVLAIQLTSNPESFAGFERAVKSIQNCPVYSLNYGTNKPYEEVCVGNAVRLAQGLR